MRKTYGRYLAVGLVGTVLLAGCAGKKESATAAATAGSFKAGTDTVLVGLIAPMTGPFASLGNNQKDSLQVEIDAVNKNGGLGGAQVKLEVRDSGLDPGKAVQEANEFAGNDAVKLVVGPALTSFYNAAKGSYEQAKKVNCQAAVGAGTFSDLKYGFRSQDPAVLDIGIMLGYLQSTGVKSLGLIYENDDTGKLVNSELASKAPQHGIKYLGQQVNQADDASHVAYVQALAGADAIWISSNSSGSKSMAAAAQAGYHGVLVGTSGLQNYAFIEAAGKAAKGATFAAPNYDYPNRDRAGWEPGYRKHIETIEKQYGVDTGPKSGVRAPRGTGIAADCVYAWSKAVTAAQSFDATKVASAIEKLNLTSAETPSGNSIAPGASHEFYSKDDIHIYQWNVDAKGWFVDDVTPKV